VAGPWTGGDAPFPLGASFDDLPRWVPLSRLSTSASNGVGASQSIPEGGWRECRGEDRVTSPSLPPAPVAVQSGASPGSPSRSMSTLPRRLDGEPGSAENVVLGRRQIHSGSLSPLLVTGASALRHTASPWAFRGASREMLVFEDFETVHGEVLPEVRVTVEEWGDSSLGPERTIAIFPSFSHGHHVAAHAANPAPGWWDEMVGPGKWIDTNRFRVVCSSVLGSPMGSTNPQSVNPLTGKQYRMGFPTVTTADQARVHAEALRLLGLDRVHAAVGSSLGGMQVLQFASLFPSKVNRIAALVSTGQTSPGSVALRRIQRQAIMADPDWREGNYGDAPGDKARGPLSGMRVAREMGMIVYRSRQEFDRRFDWAVRGGIRPNDVSFEVESYLANQGAKFVKAGALDANSYLKLSKCMDLHDITNPALFPLDTFEDAAARIRAKALFVGVWQDMLTPAHELEELARVMNARGGSARFVGVDSEFGHDAFLKEFSIMGPMLREHLEGGLEHQLELEERLTTGLSHP
jgi:homoserine O-acetyltransferase/O-succinyltransferase